MADETTETQGTQNPADTNLPAEPTTPTTPAADNVLTFTQEQLDAKMASHKRMLQRDLAAARTQAAAANDLKTKVQELLDLGIVPEGSTVDDLGQALDGLLTDKERFERETATKTAELEAASQQATEFKTLFQDQTRVNSLEQAMNEDGGKMVNEGAKELVQLLLKEKAVYGEDHSVTFKMSVLGEDGKTTEQQLSASDAIKALEAMPSKYGTLFKSTVNAGPGGQLPDGITKTSDGGIDFENLTFEQFNKLAAENPEALADHVAKM